ncbi:permease [Paenibacillus hexagrammi]|nr:permease [Paenibacillus sp. YPD9-1]
MQQALGFTNILSITTLQTFKTMFISLILEAIPFVLAGVVLSSFLQVFVSEKRIQRLIPKHPLAGILFATLLGVIFPFCECGMIPVVRRLIQKGMPVHIAAVFICAGPILNPIVYAATYMAFRTQPDMVYARMGLAFVASTLVSLLLYAIVNYNPLRTTLASIHRETATAASSHRSNQLSAMLAHAADEFFEMGKYLLFGAFLTAVIQTLVNRSSLVSIGHAPVLSPLLHDGIRLPAVTLLDIGRFCRILFYRYFF